MSTRPATAPARTALLQGQAALVVLVFVASQVGSYVHAAFERHARCPEHGELVHVDEVSQAAAPVAAGELDLLQGAGEDGHAHDHCYLCPASRDRVAPGQSAHGLAAVLPAAVEHAPGADVATRARALYTIAPKTSPPV